MNWWHRHPTTRHPKVPHKTWRRVGLSMFGILIIVIMWRWSINHLYTLPQYAIAAFTSLTTSAFYTISVVVVFLVTGLTFFSWTQSSSIQSTVQSMFEHLQGKEENKEKEGDNRREENEVKQPTRSDHWNE